MAPTTSSQHEPEDTHATSGDGATTNGQRRALSKADWTTFHGTINMSSVNAHLPVNATVPKAFHLIHIPKSAGDSVMQDSPAHMAVGQTLKGNKELPYYATVHTEKFWNDPEDNQLSFYENLPVTSFLNFWSANTIHGDKTKPMVQNSQALANWTTSWLDLMTGLPISRIQLRVIRPIISNMAEIQSNLRTIVMIHGICKPAI